MKEQLGKYVIIEQIGAGKFGIVYSAKDVEIGRLVAIKVLRPEGFASEKDKALSVKRFSTEMKAAGRLNHPNICAVFDSGLTDDGLPYLVMQLVDGKPLDVVLRDIGGALEAERALNILFQLAEALDFAHSKNVIHRDLKPSNIILADNDRPYILDFSAAFISDNSMLDLKNLAGTPQYMSPEVIQGAPPTAATDLYSLGILAYVLFTGSRPFRDGDIKATLDAIIRQSAFSFAELGCPLGARLERVLRRSLAKNPADRYSSGKEFVLACSEALNARGSNTFSQVAVREPSSIDPGASIFIKSQQKALQASNFRKLIFLNFKIICLLLLIITLSFSIILALTNKYSAVHQSLASIINLELNKQEIEALSDKQLSLLLNTDFPLSVKHNVLKTLSSKNLLPFIENLTLLLSDSDSEIRYQALSYLLKLKSENPAQIEQNLIFTLSDQDRFNRLLSFYMLANENYQKQTSSLKRKIETEEDPAVKEIMQFIIDKKSADEVKAIKLSGKQKK